MIHAMEIMKKREEKDTNTHSAMGKDTVYQGQGTKGGGHCQAERA